MTKPIPKSTQSAYDNAVRCLKRAGIRPEEAERMTDVELLGVPQFGWGRLRDFRSLKTAACPTCGQPMLEVSDK